MLTRVINQFKKAVILPLVIMAIIAYEITYSQHTYHGIGPAKASVFDKAEVGKPLSFPLTDDVHGAFVEINSLLAKFNSGFELHSPKVFFALREKAFLEILEGKPLTPHVYDFWIFKPVEARIYSFYYTKMLHEEWKKMGTSWKYIIFTSENMKNIFR